MDSNHKRVTKEEVRERFPENFKIIDEFIKVFGRDGIKRIIWIKEGNDELGSPTVHDSEKVVRLSEMCLDPLTTDEVVDGRKKYGK